MRHSELVIIYAGQGWRLRCRCDLYDLSAVRFVYRYVV